MRNQSKIHTVRKIEVVWVWLWDEVKANVSDLILKKILIILHNLLGQKVVECGQFFRKWRVSNVNFCFGPKSRPQLFLFCERIRLTESDHRIRTSFCCYGQYDYHIWSNSVSCSTMLEKEKLRYCFVPTIMENRDCINPCASLWVFHFTNFFIIQKLDKYALIFKLSSQSTFLFGMQRTLSCSDDDLRENCRYFLR